MGHNKRKPRPKGELESELVEQLGLLKLSCKIYDEGNHSVARYIALSLRVLLYSHRQSRALLDQLGLRDCRFFDSAGPLNPHNLLTECNLVGFRIDDSGAYNLPKISMGIDDFLGRIPFVKWWNDPVLKDSANRTMSRMKLVLEIANTDGGAHVDPDLDEAYIALSRENSMGWQFVDLEGNEIPPIGRIEFACVRQIAHETLSTIDHISPKFSTQPPPLSTA